MTELTDFQRVVHEPLAQNLRHTHANLDFCIKQREALAELVEQIIDAAIERWNEADTELPLHEWLGMSMDEYAAWVEQRHV